MTQDPVMDEFTTHVRPLLLDAIQRRVFPGGVVAVAGRAGRPSIVAAGNLKHTRASPAVGTQTIYDIASVTKIVTMTATLVQASKGCLCLDDRIGDILGRAIFSDITIRQVLAHTAGLRLSLSSIKDRSASDIDDLILGARPVTKPGAQFYYSSQGYYLLGKVLEVQSGEQLGECLRTQVLRPLGMDTTGFNPLVAWRQRIAPTEDDPWRGGLAWGVPHDESTFSLGGVAGHAGLFSIVEDLLKLGRLWLNDGIDGRQRLVRTDLIRESLQDNYPAAANASGFRVQRFGLGWGLDDRQFIGSLASPTACSLLGFTGPAITVDPEREVVVVILNNRVHPRRDGPSRAHHHAAITEAAMQWFRRPDD